MRMDRRPLILATACLAIFSPALAGGDRLKINLAAWPAALSGNEHVDSSSTPGTNADLKDTLGLGNSTFPELHASLKLLGPMRLIASYYNTQYDGDQTLTQSLTFNGTTYSTSERVNSQFDLKLGRALLSFSPVGFKRLHLGFMLGADLMRVNSEVSSSATGQESKGFTAPVPVVGVNLTLQPIDKLVFYFEASGLSANVGGVNGKILDGIFRVEYYFLPRFALTGGYRLFNFDVTKDSFGRVNFDQKGVQAGLAFRL